jgi:hypothetical protein
MERFLMGKKIIELISLISKLIQEYERKHKALSFSFIKRNGAYLYTGITDELLRICRLQKEDVINQTIKNKKHIIGDLYNQVYYNYEKAWSGNTVFYYLTPSTNTDIYLIITLDPQLDKNNNVYQVDAHCIAIDKKDLKVELLDDFEEHKPIE